jgi:hypothetical protein
MLTDVIIQIRDKLFPVHRIMLAKYSKYFLRLFCKMEQSCEWPHSLRIRGISADAFRVFLQLVYYGDCEITPALVQDLAKIARRFNIEELQMRIDEFILSMSPEDCLTCLQGGGVTCDDPMYKYVLLPVIRDFQRMARHPKFVELPLDILCDILSSDVLSVEREGEVYIAAMTWIQHDLCQREHYLSRVVECIRFANMEYNELFLILSDNDLLRKNAYCREMLKNAHW